eukprot:361602-Rhodomonas_salina.3
MRVYEAHMREEYIVYETRRCAHQSRIQPIRGQHARWRAQIRSDTLRYAQIRVSYPQTRKTCAVQEHAQAYTGLGA